MPSAFSLRKTSIFLSKIVPLLKSFLVLFQFLQDKRLHLWKCKFYRPCIWNPTSVLFQIGHKSEKWQWCHNLLAWRHHQFFWHCRVSLVIFGCPSFMPISLLVLELWQLEFCPIYEDLGGFVRDTKFGTNVSNKMLLNTEKCQGYSLYYFWVIKGKPTGGTPPPHEEA